MRALTPWTGAGLKTEMDRLFERFFESSWAEAPALGDWTPALDVTGRQGGHHREGRAARRGAQEIAVSSMATC